MAVMKFLSTLCVAALWWTTARAAFEGLPMGCFQDMATMHVMTPLPLIGNYPLCLAAAVAANRTYFALGDDICWIANHTGDDLSYKSIATSMNCDKYDAMGRNVGIFSGEQTNASLYVYMAVDSASIAVGAAQGCFLATSTAAAGYVLSGATTFDDCVSAAFAAENQYFGLQTNGGAVGCYLGSSIAALQASTDCDNTDAAGHRVGGSTGMYVYQPMAYAPPTENWVKIGGCANQTDNQRLLFGKNDIIAMAGSATRIKFCTRGSNLDCVVSKNGTFPIEMLRLGRAVSINNLTNCDASSGCLARTWAGSPVRLQVLDFNNYNTAIDPASKALDTVDQLSQFFISIEFNFYTYELGQMPCSWDSSTDDGSLDVLIDAPFPSASPSLSPSPTPSSSPSLSPSPNPSPSPNMTEVCQAKGMEYMANMTNSSRLTRICYKGTMRDYLLNRSCYQEEACKLWICPNVASEDLLAHC